MQEQELGAWHRDSVTVFQCDRITVQYYSVTVFPCDSITVSLTFSRLDHNHCSPGEGAADTAEVTTKVRETIQPRSRPAPEVEGSCPHHVPTSPRCRAMMTSDHRRIRTQQGQRGRGQSESHSCLQLLSLFLSGNSNCNSNCKSLSGTQ